MGRSAGPVDSAAPPADARGMARARLEPGGEITPARFAEVGRPYLICRGGVADAVALCSGFDALYWPARATDARHALRHRLSLYTGDFARRLAIFDGAWFPINDVAFHPSEPRALVATGSYDSGYCYEGALFDWNWETGETCSVLGESREVVRCRFVDGQRAAVLLRPRDDDEYGDAKAYAMVVGGVLDDLGPAPYLDEDEDDRPRDPRLATFAPVDPQHPGLDQRPSPRVGLPPQDREVLARVGFEARHCVRDVAWLDDARVAAVHDTCHVEVWRLPHARETVVRGDGHGVQLLHQGDRLLVNLFVAATAGPGPRDRTTLAYLSDGALVEWRRFDRAYACSLDRHGRLLARDTSRGQPARHDLGFDAAGGVFLDEDLGGYDCFNHYLRIDGGDALYFLQGTPPAAHPGKRLCRVDAAGVIHASPTWDDQGALLMAGCATLGLDDTIVRAYRVHHPDPRRGACAIEAWALTGAGARWRLAVDADVTALITMAERRIVVFALTSGRLGAIDARTGELLADHRLTVDGVPTVATALAARGAALVVGTIDGRLVRWELVDA